MKGRKKRSSLTAVSILLGLALGLIWLTAMACLTVVTAQEIYDKLFEASDGFLDRADSYSDLSRFYDKNRSSYGQQGERPDLVEYQMLDTIAAYSRYTVSSYGYYERYGRRSKLIRDVDYPMETAVLFYDGKGNLLHSSGDDIMYFSYWTQAEWEAGEEPDSGSHYGWVDISEGKDGDWHEGPWPRFRSAYAGVRSLYSYPLLRVTGYFEGSELKPVVLHYVGEPQLWHAVEEAGGHADSYSELDRAGRLEWELQFDRSGEFADKELVTVYVDQPRMWDYEGVPLTYQGTEYESLAQLAEILDIPEGGAAVPQWGGHLFGLGVFSPNELLVFGGYRYTDDEGFDYSTGELPEADLYLVTAIRSHPLRCAVSALRNLYLITGLLTLILFLLVRGSIKRRLVTPLRRLRDEMDTGWKSLYGEWDENHIWAEPYSLIQHYRETQETLRAQKDEVARLQTALGYAKNAEENRRRMTSNIAHELKTPLAVIHSYAEGLKEHIAEDKRDQYLDIILAETERTDGMVLELLDLSRLEAGKVKLSREEFSLTQLTKSVFERLEMAAKAKELHIRYDLPEPFPVTADEARLAQVIENFATNAIKYSPLGGAMAVRVQRGYQALIFSVENESEPLSAETLTKVWDSFYRADESRSGPGTGLGLAIAKSIVELHGGKCFARNTEGGVEFSFTLPC